MRTQISDMGLLSEWSGDRHVAVDIPAGSQIKDLSQIMLMGGRRRGMGPAMLVGLNHKIFLATRTR
jgi:hypothetical protein